MTQDFVPAGYPPIPDLSAKYNYGKAPFDPRTVDQDNPPIDPNWPIEVNITDSEWVWPRYRMPKRVPNSAFSDEVNYFVDLAFTWCCWFSFPEFVFPMWDRINQPGNYTDPIEYNTINSGVDEQLLFLDAFAQKRFVIQDLLNCAKERNDGFQCWYFINEKGLRECIKMSEIVIEAET